MSVVEETEDAIPVIFDHCCTVYKAMLERSELRSADGSRDDAMMVYEGHLTGLFRDLRMSVPYYSSVMKELKRMGCVRQLRRGGGNAPSQWELIRQPSEEAFRMNIARPGTSKTGILEQRVSDLNGRVLALEKMLGLTS